MRRIISQVRSIPLWWRLGGTIVLALLVAFVVWFFFLRGGAPVAIVQTPPPRPALGKVVSFADYRRAIGAAQTDLDTARTSSGDDRKKAVQKVKSDLESVEGAEVSPPVAGAKPSEVDNSLILSELGSDDPNLAAVASALSSLGSTLDTVSSAGVQGVLTGQPAIDALNRVLTDPIFDYTRNETPLQKLADWLAGLTGQGDPGDTLWRWFLALIAGLSGGALTYLATDRIPNRWLRLGVSVLAGLVVGLLFLFGAGAVSTTIEVLGVVGLVVAAIAVGLVASGLNRASSPSSVQPVSELAQVLGMSAVEARKRAEEAASEGNYRNAIRYRCLAVLLALDEVGMLTFDRTATNREYLFRAPGNIHDGLQPLLDRFDQVWYGDASTDAQEWGLYDAKAASIEARVAAEVRSQSKAA